MFEMLFWGAVLRMCQAFVQATPTILVGLLVAGVFRRLVGHERTRRLFGGGTWGALFKAWLMGMLLPVCSLGVIPVVREMRRAGVSGGVILAFGLTAPLFNPLSVLYGLTLANPLVIITFSFCSLVIVTVVALAWDRLFPGTASPDEALPEVAAGIKRILSVATAASRELVGPTALYILMGLVGVGLLSVVLPNGSLMMSAEHDDPFAPLLMTLVAIPAYATPMTAMVQLASMFQHGNSVGAAFSLLALGAGANLGLFAWIGHTYGWRRSLAWFGILLAVVVALAYAVDKPLYPRGVEPAGHTHAFDGYCCPFTNLTADPAGSVVAILREKTAAYELVSIAVLGVLAIAGLALVILDRRWSIEAWLEHKAQGRRRYDLELPGPVLGGVVLGGLVAASIFGCYVYYPPPAEVLAEMQMINAEVVVAAKRQDWDTAAYWIPIYDDWSRKLEVSVILRGGDLSASRRAKANVLRYRLELLKHEVEDCEIQEAEKVAGQVSRAYLRLRAAYGDEATNEN
jgi:uncharacterized membrane protein YraQ (UPF0718 family)